MKREFLQQQRGFTLLELMIGFTLSIVLLAAVVPALSINVKVWFEGSAGTEVQQSARHAVDTMVRELRYGDTYSLQSSTDISFRDIKSGTTVRYFLSGGKLYRETVGSPQPLTGDNPVTAQVVVHSPSGEELFSLRGDQPSVVYIALAATDTVTNQNVTLRTAVAGMSGYIK